MRSHFSKSQLLALIELEKIVIEMEIEQGFKHYDGLNLADRIQTTLITKPRR